MAAGLSTALLVTGCAPAESQNTSPVPLRAQGVARVVPPADAPVSAVAQGVTAFGHELIPRIKAGAIEIDKQATPAAPA